MKPFFHYCIVVLIIAIPSGSCFQHYYKTNTTHAIDSATLQKLQSSDKYFILHGDSNVFALKNVKCSNDSLSGDLEDLAIEYKQHMNPRAAKGNRFRAKDRQFVLYEVHLYCSNRAQMNTHFQMRIKDIKRLDIYALDKAATTRSTILSIAGITVATAGIVAIVVEAIVAAATSAAVASTSCNCPQVYTFNGDKPEFHGGLYSGAIYASLERTDYMPLNRVQPVAGKLKVKIGSVQGEEQIINEVSLLQIVHQKESHVLLDRNGRVLLYSKPIAPDQAVINEKEDVTDEVRSVDQKYYSFNSLASDEHTSDIILKFKKPAGASSGKLILQARNSAWSGYLFHEFRSLFGEYYTTWTQKKDNADPKEMQQWQMDQSLPLMVSVKKGNDWKYLDYFATPGNTAERDMIMQLDLTDFKNADHIQIRLQTAYMFWDLDYAGVDFSESDKYQCIFLPAATAIKSDSSSQETALGKKDGQYTHLTDHEFLNLSFNTEPSASPDQVNSYFLVSSGYYHLNGPFTGKPQVTALKAFLEKRSFDKFSRMKFNSLQTTVSVTR